MESLPSIAARVRHGHSAVSALTPMAAMKTDGPRWPGNCSDVRLLLQISAALQIQVTSAICRHANMAWSLKAGLVARWALPAISRALGIFIASRRLRRGWCYVLLVQPF